MDGKFGPRCGMLLSELAPDVESALDLGIGSRLGTNPRYESNIYFLNSTYFKSNNFFAFFLLLSILGAITTLFQCYMLTCNF